MLAYLLVFGLFLAAPGGPDAAAGAAGGQAMALNLESAVFREGARIPVKHTCDGPDVSPPLSWSGLPEGTTHLALICDDPDAPAGNWVHWVLYDLPAAAPALAEGAPKERELKSGGRQGLNGFRKTGYGGPCPPPGPPHRYFFKLYALDGPLGLPPGAHRDDVLRAMKGHVLAEAQLMGRYGR